MSGTTMTNAFRSLYTLGSPRDASDGDLVQRFVAGRDEGAFAALVRRHGPMGLGVPRAPLARPDDAEDVFQATFLLLATKSATIRRRDSVGSWLHGVARRLAVRRRRQAACRAEHERRAAAARPAATGSASAW